MADFDFQSVDLYPKAEPMDPAPNSEQITVSEIENGSPDGNSELLQRVERLEEQIVGLERNLEELRKELNGRRRPKPKQSEKRAKIKPKRAAAVTRPEFIRQQLNSQILNHRHREERARGLQELEEQEIEVTDPGGGAINFSEDPLALQPPRPRLQCKMCPGSVAFPHAELLAFHYTSHHQGDVTEAVKSTPQPSNVKIEPAEALQLPVELPVLNDASGSDARPWTKRYKEEKRQLRQLRNLERRTCPKCSRIFTTFAHLKRHLATFHEPPQFKCPDCGQLFRRVDNMNTHIERVHAIGNRGPPPSASRRG